LKIAAQQNRHIGQELHDHTQQQLAGIGLLAQCLADRLVETSSEDSHLAARIAREIKETGKHVQLLARGLVLVEVDPQGLRAALADLALRISELHHGHCEHRCFESVAVANNFVATHLYRIAQEAVTNALKHGQANHIIISLAETDGNLTLTIVDDGSGIDESCEFEPGMGLRIMSYRAGLIGGTLRVSRREGGGTQVECTVWHSPAGA
jgi:two-component system, LuxR family, sensor kinase FixL